MFSVVKDIMPFLSFTFLLLIKSIASFFEIGLLVIKVSFFNKFQEDLFLFQECNN